MTFAFILYNHLCYFWNAIYVFFYALQRLRHALSDLNCSRHLPFCKYYHIYIYTYLYLVLSTIHVVILHTILLKHTQKNKTHTHTYIYRRFQGESSALQRKVSKVELHTNNQQYIYPNWTFQETLTRQKCSLPAVLHTMPVYHNVLPVHCASPYLRR
jgi:hypothetical protein